EPAASERRRLDDRGAQGAGDIRGNLKGADQSRTGVRGFAGLCLTTRPRRRARDIVAAPPCGLADREVPSLRMATTSTLVQQKLDQAVEILREHDVDLWLTFVRETMLTHDPCLDLIAGTYSAWTGAFLVSSSGERGAIVGRFDVPSLVQTGPYEVMGYDESPGPGVVEAVDRLSPRTIALNYSTSDPAADGLTHGLWLELQSIFEGTRFADAFESSESIVNALRGR